MLSWSKPFETVQSGSFAEGDVAWFLEGELNVAFNCVDRHALATPEKVKKRVGNRLLCVQVWLVELCTTNL